MNAAILATRKAAAMASIEAETARLGGVLKSPVVRGDASTTHCLYLEAIAEALAGIDIPTSPRPKRTKDEGSDVHVQSRSGHGS